MRAMLIVAATLGAATIACSSDDTATLTLTGAYHATSFHVTPTGQAAIDVLAAGGSLTITIAASGTTSGTLNIPASVGGTLVNESMAGTAVQSGSNVTFTQNADTFVRDLTWTLSSSSLTVSNQTAGSASYSITLTKQ